MSPVWKYEVITWDRYETSDRHKCLHETCRKFLFSFCGLLQINLLLLNAALPIRIQLKARKKERITPFLLRTNIPRLRERTIKNKRRWWIAPGRTDCWWMKMWNEEALPSEWNKNFRMTREQFVLLADEISPFISPDPSVWFSLVSFLLSAILEWSNNTLAHAQNSDLWPTLTGLKSVRVYMVPWSDFRPVRVIRVGSATGMSETGMRRFFRPASCRQWEAFVWRPIWSRTGLSSYRSHVIKA